MYYLYNSPLYRADLQWLINDKSVFEDLAGKRILITGATGLIGSFLVDVLSVWNSLTIDKARKIQIYAGGRSCSKLEQRFSGAPEHQSICFVPFDLNNEFEINFEVDYVIHAASNAYPAAFSKDPVGTIISNIAGTYRLLNYAYINHVERFMFLSTGEVYGQGDIACRGFSELDSGYLNPMETRSCYPSAKRTAETLCASYQKQYGVNTVVARPCHIYGPNVTPMDNRATVQFVKNAVSGQNIVLKSKGEQIRSYCYIADCVSAVLTILSRGQSGQAYNIANRNSVVSIAEFAQYVAQEVGVAVVFQLPAEQEKAEQTPITRAVLSAEKLEKLGWSGRYDITTGIHHTVEIMRRN